MVEGDVSHDPITRFLSAQEYTSKDLWREVKSTVRSWENKRVGLIFDDTIQEKACFDFTTSQDRHFVAALKSNRLVALSEEDRKKKRFVHVDELNFTEHTAMQCWLKGYAKAVRLVRQVFTNKDGSTGILHLACSDLTCDYDEITTTYKKRWQVEVFHKSLKSNASLAKSPTRTVRTQSNHVFMAIVAAFKLECLSHSNKLNPFALCRKLLINASRSAYEQLQLFRATA